MIIYDSMKIRASRKTDPIEGQVDSLLLIDRQDNGDTFVEIHGQDEKGRPVFARVQFLSFNGGGYHPHTQKALYDLAEAMKRDNQDKSSERKYGKQ